MKTFQFGKIIRGRFLDRLDQYGGSYEKVDLTPDESIAELKKKLLEETTEILSATSEAELLEEMGDLQEVLHSLLKALNISTSEFQKICDEKNKDRGSIDFTQKIIRVSISEDSEDLKKYRLYLEANPDRYPEIK